MKRASSTLPFHDRLPRTVRCGRKPDEKSVTFGAVFEKTPVPPSAQRSGMALGFAA